jgi:hypothetical protein
VAARLERQGSGRRSGRHNQTVLFGATLPVVELPIVELLIVELPTVDGLATVDVGTGAGLVDDDEQPATTVAPTSTRATCTPGRRGTTAMYGVALGRRRQ